MNTEQLLLKEENRFVEELDSYIQSLRKQRELDEDAAYAQAKKALINTGVLDKNGNPKKRIVTWD